MAIGKQIVKRLNELGWKNRDLLDRVPSLSTAALHNLIKRDSKRSEFDVLIADALGISVMQLVYGDETYPTGNVIPLTARERMPRNHNKLLDELHNPPRRVFFWVPGGYEP